MQHVFRQNFAREETRGPLRNAGRFATPDTTILFVKDLQVCAFLGNSGRPKSRVFHRSNARAIRYCLRAAANDVLQIGGGALCR